MTLRRAIPTAAAAAAAACAGHSDEQQSPTLARTPCIQSTREPHGPANSTPKPPPMADNDQRRGTSDSAIVRVRRPLSSSTHSTSSLSTPARSTHQHADTHIACEQQLHSLICSPILGKGDITHKGPAFAFPPVSLGSHPRPLTSLPSTGLTGRPCRHTLSQGQRATGTSEHDVAGWLKPCCWRAQTHLPPATRHCPLRDDPHAAPWQPGSSVEATSPAPPTVTSPVAQQRQ